LREANLGLLYGVAAYLFWGVIPIYWKQLSHISALELLAHRVVWAVFAFGAAVMVRRRGDAVRAALRDRRVRWTLVLSAALLSINWLTFIYAINTNRLLHASLGYFINPLVSVVLGMVFLRERLRPLEWAAVAFAAAGVLQLGLQASAFPWISLVLAGSFGFYGLLRKTVRVDALPGSSIEVMLVAPACAIYLAVLAGRGDGQLGHTGLQMHLLLLASGTITMAPLVWFANAARRLTLATIGFLQYLAPTGQFLLAVFLWDEPFAGVQARSFACIWIGLAIFSIERVRQGVTFLPPNSVKSKAKPGRS
jgi:chloramphenicol-sensitive protein RarD